MATTRMSVLLLPLPRILWSVLILAGSTVSAIAEEPVASVPTPRITMEVLLVERIEPAATRIAHNPAMILCGIAQGIYRSRHLGSIRLDGVTEVVAVMPIAEGATAAGYRPDKDLRIELRDVKQLVNRPRPDRPRELEPVAILSQSTVEFPSPFIGGGARGRHVGTIGNMVVTLSKPFVAFLAMEENRILLGIVHARDQDPPTPTVGPMPPPSPMPPPPALPPAAEQPHGF